MPDSIFSTISRYEPSPERRPREDMLTQCFAALLDHVDGLAAFVVDPWIPGNIESLGTSGVQIKPQRPTLTGGQRVDLEIQFGTGEKSLTVWIEVKRGAPLSPGQLQSYSDALAARRDPGRFKCLVFLPPSSYVLAASEMPDSPRVEFVHSNWQKIGRRLLEWKEGPTNPGGFERELVDQFITYLREEQLLVTQAFTDNHRQTLDSYQTSIGAFVNLIQLVEGRVDSHVMATFEPRGDPVSRRKQPTWPIYYRVWNDVPGLGGLWLEWDVRRRSDEATTFGAGLTASASDMNFSRFAALRESDFKDCSWDGLNRLFAHRPIEEITDISGIEDQAEELFQFVCGAFDQVIASAHRQ